MEQTGKRDATPDDFMRCLPTTSCRYAIYDFDYSRPDGRPASKLFFVAWLPVTGAAMQRMFYTSQKNKVVGFFSGIGAALGDSGW